MEAKRWRPLVKVWGVGKGGPNFDLAKEENVDVRKLYRSLYAVDNTGDVRYRTRFLKPKLSYTFNPMVKDRITSWRKTIFRYSKDDFKGGKISESFRNKSPLPISKLCKFIGSYWTPLGFRKSKIISPCFGFYEYLSSKYKDIQDLFFDIDIQVITGGYDTNCPNLKQMATPNEHKFSYEELLSGLEGRCGVDLKLPRCGLPTVEDIDYVRINPKAYPGVVMNSFFGSSRGQVAYASIPIARDLYTMASKRPLRDVSLWACGGREKPVKLHKDGEFRTRLIMMPEDPSMRIASVISGPITAGLRENQAGSLFIGRTFESGKYDFFSKLMKGRLVADCDWSKFDNYVYEELIVTAFGILRSCYEDSVELDNIFLFVMSGFIFKNVVLPDGLIFQLAKGIPSGSPFTSLIGTVVNWLVWSTVLSKTAPDFNSLMDTRVICCGDDTLLLLPFTMWGTDIDKVVHKSGLINDGINHLIRPARCNFQEGQPHFLKKRLSPSGLPSWDMKDVMQNMLYPPRDSRYLTKEEERAKMITYIAPFNLYVVEVLDNYRRWLYEKMYVPPGETPSKIAIKEMRKFARSSSVAWSWFLHKPDKYSIYSKADDDWVYANRRRIKCKPNYTPNLRAFGMLSLMGGSMTIGQLRRICAMD